MFYSVKRDPVWLDLPLGEVCGKVHLLSECGDQVSVPTAVLLAASPLLRSLVSDIHPTVPSPLHLSLAVSTEVLRTVGEILYKGVTFVNDDRIWNDVNLVFKMMGLEASLAIDKIEKTDVGQYITKNELQSEAAKKWKDVVEESDSKIKLEVTVELENVKDFKDINLNENGASDITNKNEDGHVVTFNESGVDSERSIGKSVNHIMRQNADHYLSKPRERKNASKDSSIQVMHPRKMLKGRVLYKCDHCDYKTNNKGNLVRHTRKHTGEKPFKCGLCYYQSGQRVHMKTHMIKHSGEKPYSCEFCTFKLVLQDT